MLCGRSLKFKYNQLRRDHKWIDQSHQTAFERGYTPFPDSRELYYSIRTVFVLNVAEWRLLELWLDEEVRRSLGVSSVVDEGNLEQSLFAVDCIGTSVYLVAAE